MPTTFAAVADATAIVNDDLNIVTLVRSVQPASVGKRYFFAVDGTVDKIGVANISEGVATSWNVRDAGAMATILEDVAARTDRVICPALWNGDDGHDFTMVTEAELSRLTGHPMYSPALGGLHRVASRPDIVAARLRRGLQHTAWFLMDADNPPGIPADWAAMNMQQRLEFMELVAPGCSTCERIELRGSSARVRMATDPQRGATHAWLRCDDPANLPKFKAAFGVNMVLHDRAFQSPRHSHVDGHVIGHVYRSVFDLSVWDAGRLVFCSLPEISADMRNAGYVVDPADVRIVNEGAGPLIISGITLPSDADRAAYESRTGDNVTFSTSSGTLNIASRGVLTPETEIESAGRVQTFGQWLAGMQDGDTLRCEAPFRASVSEAAFIRRTGNGEGYIHDVGNSTTYHMDIETARAADAVRLGEMLARVTPPEVVAATVEASQARQGTTNQGDRHMVMCDDGIEHLVVARIVEELPHLSSPRVFRRGGGLTFVSKTTSVRMFDGVAWQDHKTTGMNMVKTPWLCAALSNNIAFMKTRGRNIVPANTPRQAVEAAMQSELDNVPPLQGIISTPTMRPDGSLLDAQGFDDLTGFWIDHELTVSVPETPTRDDALASLDILNSLLEGYPFASDLDGDAALAHLMGAVLRPLFPTMPGLLIDAPMAGSGKSHLTNLIGLVAHGRIAPTSNWPKGEELSKHLDALMLAGVPYIAFDNCNQSDIGGEKICSLFTQSVVSVRVLGESRNVEIPTSGTVVTINGNHPRVREDATQRFIRCYITPSEMNPRERDFRNDPHDMVHADRGKYVSAVLTIMRAYLAAGSPGAVGYGSFDRWSRTVRSSLIWLGLDDVLNTTRATMAEDPELARLQTVLNYMVAHVGVGVAFTVSGFVAALASADPTAIPTLGAAVGVAGLATPDSVKQRTGTYIRGSLMDRVLAVAVAGAERRVKVVRVGQDRNGGVLWRIDVMAG